MFTSVRWYLVLSFLLYLFLSSPGQPSFDVMPAWSHLAHQSGNIYQQFLQEADSLAKKRRDNRQLIRTEEELQIWQKQMRAKLWELLGAPPKRTPLEPIITGRLNHEKYFVEKLFFQSYPGFYVTAALFVPKNINLPAPAILFCSGHSDEGFRSHTYQHMILNYVQKGFIVLAFDPLGQGERYQYFNEEGMTYLRPTHEHSKGGNQVFLSGMSPAHYFIWDGIRAIDYLVSRDEVDPTRIGVTGRSGGGTQSAYLMALDDRIAVAAPECYLTTFDKLLRSRGPQDAEQNIKYFLKHFSLSDLISLRVPKPTLMVTTTRDIFSIAGARDLYEEARYMYHILDAEDRLQMVEDDAGHSSTKRNREATYAFFQKHLLNPGNPIDERIDTLAQEDLWVSRTGQISQEIEGETMFSLNRKYVKSLIKENRTDTDLTEQIADLIGYRDAVLTDVIYSGADQWDNKQVEKYLMEIDGSHHLPMVWLKPAESSKHLVILLDEAGKEAQAKKGSIANQLLEQGHQVVLIDLNGVGEMSEKYHGGDARLGGVPINLWYAGILVKRSPLALRLAELEAVYGYIKDVLASDTKIHMLAKGILGAEALHSAPLLPVESTMLISPLISYEALAANSDYEPRFFLNAIAGALPVYDLPDLARFTNRLLILNMVDGQEQIVPVERVRKKYANESILQVEAAQCDTEEVGERVLDFISSKEE